MALFGRLPTLCIGLALVAQLPGCGMRGPPQAPLIRMPAPVSEIDIQRLGDVVFLGFTPPVENQDGVRPADIERVDVYAMTVQPRIPAERRLDLEEFQEAATLVATVEIAPPVQSDAPEVDDPGVDPRPAQGFPVVLSETLTPEMLAPVDPWEEERRQRQEDEEPPIDVPVPLGTPMPGPLQRRYAVVGVSSDGNESEPAERVAVPLFPAPFPPSPPVVTYGAEAVDIVWELPVGVRGTVQEPVVTEDDDGDAPDDSSEPSGSDPATDAAPGPFVGPPVPPDAADLFVGPPAPADAPADLFVGPPAPADAPADLFVGPPAPADALADLFVGPPAPPDVIPDSFVGPPRPPAILFSRPIVEWPPASRYELFEIVEPEDDRPVMPRPLNVVPLAVTTYTDDRIEFGVERCYAVLTLDSVAEFSIRSALSEPTCVTLVDTFPPEAPTGLTAVGGEGAVNLIWQPGEEDDLGGYLVLRGVPAGETLLPLTVEPVLQNSFRDTTAAPGVRYVYAVQAVDDAAPANVSPMSDQVEAAAR